MTDPRRALASFYEREGLPADGGVTATTDTVRFLGLPLTIPNPPVRARVLPIHDLHHLVTGYGTDEIGEGEVSAWALGAGNRHHLFGLVYDSGGFLAGFVQAPKRCAAAFYRGRRGRTLYDQPAAHWMEQSVEEIRLHCGSEADESPPSAVDRIALAATVPFALLMTLTLPLVNLIAFGMGGERPEPFVT